MLTQACKSRMFSGELSFSITYITLFLHFVPSNVGNSLKRHNSHFKLARMKSTRAYALPSASALALALVSSSTTILKFYQGLYYPDHLMDLFRIWYDDRYRSGLSFSSILQWPIGHIWSNTRSLDQIK